MNVRDEQVLYTVASLGIADILAEGPQTAQQIASKIGEHNRLTHAQGSTCCFFIHNRSRFTCLLLPTCSMRFMMTALYPDGNTWELYRVLRTAVQIGLFTISKDHDVEGKPRFQNNRLSALLREDHPNCLKHMVSKGRT